MSMLHDSSDVGGEYGVHNQDYPAAPLGCKDSNTSNHLVGCQINVGKHLVRDIVLARQLYYFSFLRFTLLFWLC